MRPLPSSTGGSGSAPSLCWRSIATVRDGLNGRVDMVATDVTAHLDFLEGKVSEAELLGRPLSDEPERSRRHYIVGWKRLGAGDRTGAERRSRRRTTR